MCSLRCLQGGGLEASGRHGIKCQKASRTAKTSVHRRGYNHYPRRGTQRSIVTTGTSQEGCKLNSAGYRKPNCKRCLPKEVLNVDKIV